MTEALDGTAMRVTAPDGPIAAAAVVAELERALGLPSDGWRAAARPSDWAHDVPGTTEPPD